MQVLSLGREDPLEEGMATHSSILAWRILMEKEAWGATVHSVAKSQTQLKQLSMHDDHLTYTEKAYSLTKPIFIPNRKFQELETEANFFKLINCMYQKITPNVI